MARQRLSIWNNSVRGGGSGGENTPSCQNCEMIDSVDLGPGITWQGAGGTWFLSDLNGDSFTFDAAAGAAMVAALAAGVPMTAAGGNPTGIPCSWSGQLSFTADLTQTATPFAVLSHTIVFDVTLTKSETVGVNYALTIVYNSHDNGNGNGGQSGLVPSMSGSTPCAEGVQIPSIPGVSSNNALFSGTASMNLSVPIPQPVLTVTAAKGNHQGEHRGFTGSNPMSVTGTIDSNTAPMTADLGAVVNNANGTWTWTHTPVLADDGATVTVSSGGTDVMFPIVVRKAIYFDPVTGNDDTGDGLTNTTPYKTIGRAALLADADTSFDAILGLAGSRMTSADNFLGDPAWDATTGAERQLRGYAMRIDDVSGTAARKFVVSTYGGLGPLIFDDEKDSLPESAELKPGQPRLGPGSENIDSGVLTLRGCNHVVLDTVGFENGWRAGLAVTARAGGTHTGNQVHNYYTLNTGGRGVFWGGQTDIGTVETKSTDGLATWGKVDNACENVERVPGPQGATGDPGLGWAGEAFTLLNGHCVVDRLWITGHHKEGFDAVDLGEAYASNVIVEDAFPTGVYATNSLGPAVYFDGASDGLTNSTLDRAYIANGQYGIQIAAETGGTVTGVGISNAFITGMSQTPIRFDGFGFPAAANSGILSNSFFAHCTAIVHPAQFGAANTQANNAKAVGLAFTSLALVRETGDQDMIFDASTPDQVAMNYNALYNAGNTVTGSQGSNFELGDPQLVDADVDLFASADDPYVDNPAFVRPGVRTIKVPGPVTSSLRDKVPSAQHGVTTDIFGHARTFPTNIGAS